jgi:hypothetical protein
MDSDIRHRFDTLKSAPLTWHPVKGGKRSWLCFEDSLTEDVGPDSAAGFDAIATRMLDGRYYPPDAIQYYCDAIEEGRSLRAGDRVLQRAPILPFLPSMGVWSMVEIFVAERSVDRCHLGYVTTANHHGRGIWEAELTRIGGRLSLKVTSTTSPQSWLYWIGLPLARYLQLRARRRAIEEFRKVVSKS